MNLRTRLVLSNILIVVLCLGIAAVSVSLLLQNYRDETSITRLENMTRPIYLQVRGLLRFQPNLTDLWTSVQEQAVNNKVFILFVDSAGNLLFQGSPVNTGVEFDIPGGLPHGSPQTESGILTAASGQRFVYIAYPFGRQFTQQTEHVETMIFCEPRSSLAAVMAGLITPFIWAGIIALAISLVLAFLLARSVYFPIRRLSQAAGDIARGHYQQKVPVTGPPEIKKLAANFNEMAEKVNESQQQLRSFVADVSHQLKNPLTSIHGFAEAILDGTAEDKETREKAARIILEESERMMRQVNDLLEYSRMQAGQARMARETVDVKEVLGHCREIFALRFEEQGITVKNDTGPAAAVTGDADRLGDVFCNLLDNAIKNTPPGGEIRILARQTPDRRSLAVTIADTGPGIPPEQLPHVFERFQQSRGPRTGFGLGLAIAREIVLAHGGEIEVTSSPGAGARFTVTLPVEKP